LPAFRWCPAHLTPSHSQRAIGFGVLGGMASAMVLGIYFVPLFYLWVKTLFPKGVEGGAKA
jgi:multidrug efflux pump subunit AcrB